MSDPSPRAVSAVRLTAAMCTSQVLGQLGAFTFPALLPVFFAEWNITHTEAGWLSGIFFGAYALGVPMLVTATDKVDPRRIYMLAVGISTISHIGMAVAATDFATGMVFRTMAGVGWAGTYMVGLKALADLTEGAQRTRAVSFHAASIGVGGALSFVAAGAIETLFNWQAAFLVAAGGTLAALIIVLVFMPARTPQPAEPDAPETKLLDFGPVFRNRSAMAYSLSYCAHTWEMFALRSWVVAFLAFAAMQSGDKPEIFVPTVIATLMGLVGTATSVFGNEIAIRFGRQRWILFVFFVSMAMAAMLGFSAGWGYGAAAAFCLIYNGFIYADSSSLTAGTVGSAAPGKRGATLAVHAMLGYAGGFVGPLVVGIILDALGGETVYNWGIAFGHIALVLVVGPLALLILRPKDMAGDRASGK